jgi:hypothetical protein
MSLIVIGGHSRSVGKTSVVAGLIAALPELRWTALKITQYGHGICSANGKPCSCACDDHSWAITEEKDRSGESDSSRFLLAGAVQSWWVRAEQGRLADAMPRVREILANAENTIVESNSLLNFVDPDLYLTVIDPATADFKKSALQFLNRANAVVLHDSSNGKNTESERPGVSRGKIPLNPDKPILRIQPPPYVTPELVEFVKSSLPFPSTTRY